VTAQTEVPVAIADSLTDADAALARLDAALARIGDGDLHRAHRDGGWTVAQCVVARQHVHDPLAGRPGPAPAAPS
jgi:hypothetical protein